MIIDKINLRSKSLNRLPFIFAPKDNEWLAKVDDVKTFDDVLTLAKEMLDWQKEQVEQMKKLPDFDNISVIKNYELNDDDEDDFGDDEMIQITENSRMMVQMLINQMMMTLTKKMISIILVTKSR